ncbi:MAG: trans-aconitate 2-methyltransferase [Candidimonas sp.]|nr:MAG: trans-aconitate 2-methyltransferase [Candidimonas sp.]
MAWSADQYLRFERERTRPARDLLAAVHTQSVHRAADLGCGPGNSTELLATRFPDATITGVDSSGDMLATARRRLLDTPDQRPLKIQLEQADIATWTPPEAVDVILANAALQWIPDHRALLPRLMGHIAPGGSLAVQMPDNQDEPARRLMRDVAATGPWAGKIADESTTRFPRHPPDWYYTLLRPDASRIDIWRTTYYHVLPGGVAAIVEWFKGSSLRPFLAPLGGDEKKAYLARYLAELRRVYPAQPNGAVLLPFPRLFIVATR